MEVGEEGIVYTYRYTSTARMTPALKSAAMRAILMFRLLWGTKSQDSVHRPQLLKRKESRSETDQAEAPVGLTELCLSKHCA